MASLEIQVTGLKEVERGLQEFARDAPKAALQAMNEECETVMTDAKRRTPVQTGALRSSGHVEVRPNKQEIALLFGDAAVDYAVPVHEDMKAHHPTGEAKFLERALDEAVPGMLSRLARRIREIVRA